MHRKAVLPGKNKLIKTSTVVSLSAFYLLQGAAGATSHQYIRLIGEERITLHRYFAFRAHPTLCPSILAHHFFYDAFAAVHLPQEKLVLHRLIRWQYRTSSDGISIAVWWLALEFMQRHYYTGHSADLHQEICPRRWFQRARQYVLSPLRHIRLVRWFYCAF